MIQRAGGVLLVALLVVGAASAATPTASLSGQSSQQIPEQTITFENEQFYPNSVSVKDPGDTLNLDVTIDNSQQYKLAIYNTDEQIVTQKERTGGGTVTFDLTDYNPGTYMVTVIQDGDYLAIHPLLIRSHSVSMSAPSESAVDEPLRLEATTQQLRGTELDHVEFIVTDGTDRVRANATKSGDTYITDIDVSSLDPGSYEVYATVRGSEVAFGEAEFYGVSEGNQLNLVNSTPTPTESGSSGGGGGTSGGGAGGGTGASTGTATVTPTVTSSATPTAEQTATPIPSPTLTPTQSETPLPTVTSSPTQTATGGDDVTTPVSPTPTPSPTSGSGPGFGILAVIVALVGFLLRRRSR